MNRSSKEERSIFLKILKWLGLSVQIHILVLCLCAVLAFFLERWGFFIYFALLLPMHIFVKAMYSFYPLTKEQEEWLERDLRQDSWGCLPLIALISIGSYLFWLSSTINSYPQILNWIPNRMTGNLSCVLITIIPAFVLHQRLKYVDHYGIYGGYNNFIFQPKVWKAVLTISFKEFLTILAWCWTVGSGIYIAWTIYMTIRNLDNSRYPLNSLWYEVVVASLVLPFIFVFFRRKSGPR